MRTGHGWGFETGHVGDDGNKVMTGGGYSKKINNENDIPGPTNGLIDPSDSSSSF